MAAARVPRGGAAALAAAGALLGAVVTCIPPCPRAAAAEAPSAVRVEARSADFLAVGLVRDGVMTIHVSRLLDNAPLHDVTVTVNLRGVAHPAVAEADGSYSVHAPELSLPGSATVVFTVLEGSIQERLSGTLQLPGGASATGEQPSNAARQYGWWALNFAVCIGFLYLWSRRRKSDD